MFIQIGRGFYTKTYVTLRGFLATDEIHSMPLCTVAKLTAERMVTNGAINADVSRLLAMGISCKLMVNFFRSK